MKRIIPLLACLIVGIGVGWYASNTLTNAENKQGAMQLYHELHDKMQLTDAQLVEMGNSCRSIFKTWSRKTGWQRLSA